MTEEGIKCLKHIYVSLMGLLVVSYLYMMLMNSETAFEAPPYSIPLIIWVLRLLAAVLAFSFPEVRRDKGFLVLSAYFLWFTGITMIRNSDYLFSEEVSSSLLSGVWIFSACYGFGRILDKKQILNFFRIITTIWTVCMTISAIIGIYAAGTDRIIYNPNHGSFWGMFQWRLMLLYLSTTSGAVLSFSCMISIFAIFCEKRSLVKVLYGICSIIMLMALALTDARTALISLAIGTGTLAASCMLKWSFWYRRKDKPYKRAWYAWPSSVAVAVLVFMCTIFGTMQLTGVYNHFRIQGGLLLSRACAETFGFNRGFKADTAIFSGRWEIWKASFQYLLQNPVILLTGVGKYLPTARMEELISQSYSHFHCMPIQILFESGLCGLTLIMIFMVYTGICAFRIFKSRFIPIWQRALPACFLMLCVGEIAECFTWLRASQIIHGAALFAVSGAIICLGNRKMYHDEVED